jgi:hypothetical protein
MHRRIARAGLPLRTRRRKSSIRQFDLLEPRTLLSTGWELQSFDDPGTRFYPESSRVAVGSTPFHVQSSFQENWHGLSVPALTGDLFGTGKLDLVVPNGTDVDIYDAGGDKLTTLKGVGNLDILGDVTGAGHPQILVDYMDPTSESISIRAYDGNGALVKAYSLQSQAPDAFLFAANVSDLFGDGRRELVANVGSLNSLSPRGIAVFDCQSGALINYNDEASIASNISIGDIFHDGRKELVFGNWGQWTGQDGWDRTRDDSSYIRGLSALAQPLWQPRLYFSGPDNFGRSFDSTTGTYGPGFPYVSSPSSARTSTGYNDSSALMASFLGNGNLQIAATAGTDLPSAAAYLNWLAQNPGTLPIYPTLPNLVGRLELLDPTTGQPLAGYTRSFNGPVRVLASADLAGNGRQQILLSQYDPATSHWFLRAISPTAGLPDAATFDLGQATSLYASPLVSVCDATGSGSPEVVAVFGQTLHVLSNDLTERWSWDAGSGQILIDAIESDLNNDGRIELIASSFDPTQVVSSGSIPITVNVLAPPTGGTTTAIPPDRFEPNNSQATAAPLGSLHGFNQFAGLTIYQSGKDEWFKFQTVGPGTSDNSVAIDFDHTQGVLDLALVDASGASVGSSLAGADHREVSLAGVPAGTYFIHIAGHSGATSPAYTLTIDAPVGSAIPKDSLEPNSSLALATDLNPPDTTAGHSGQDAALAGSKTVSNISIYSPTDVDYFKFTTGARGVDGNFVQINFDNTQGQLDLALLDSLGNVVLAFPPAHLSQETISLSGLDAGAYYVRVSGHDGATNPSYSLTVVAPQSAGPGQPPDWTGGSHTSLAAALDLGAISGPHTPYTGLSINRSGVDEWFEFETPATGTQANLVSTTFASALGQLGLELDDQSGNVLYSSTSPTDFQLVSLDGLAAGTYYIRVFGLSGATNPDYTLFIVAPTASVGTTITPDWAELNNTKDTAYDLGAVQGKQPWTGLSIYQSGKDEWFRFSVANPGDVTVRIDFSYAQGGLDLSVIDPGGATGVSNRTTDFQGVKFTESQGGTYYVRVSGYAGATNPNYTLTVTAPTKTIAKDWIQPPNNSQNTAYDLGNIQGPQELDKLSIYQNGADEWFKFTTAAAGGQADQARIDFDSSQGALDLALVDGSGTVLAQSTAVGTGRAVSLAGLNSGTYFVHVFGVNGATNPRYSLVIHAPTASQSAAQWDVLLYGDGDQTGGQNRDYDVAHDIQTLEQVQLPSQVNVGVLWGRSTESSWGTNTVEGWLTFDQNSRYGYPSSQLAPVTDASGGDPAMSDPNTLRDYLIKMVTDRPAAHYAVIIKDHGAAWSGAEEDDAARGIMTPANIASALAAAEQQTGKKIDLVAFDTCLNATIETLYQLRAVTDVVVASEAETYSPAQNTDGTWPAATWNLSTMVQALATNPSLSPEQFASTMVADMTPDQTQALGATRTSAYAGILSALSAFAEAARNDLADTSAIAQARDYYKAFAGAFDVSLPNNQTYSCPNDHDLGLFMELLAANTSVQPGLSQAAGNVVTALNQAVISVRSRKSVVQGVQSDNYSGVAAFLPQGNDLTPFAVPDYFNDTEPWIDPSTFDFFQASGNWSQFVLHPTTTTQGGNGITFGQNLLASHPARATANPLHALAGSWQVGTFALDPLAREAWFQFQTLAPGTPDSDVSITFPSALGNLTLELYDASGNRLLSSSTTSGIEQLSLEGQPAGTYYIHVTGPQGNPGFALAINAPSVAQPQQDWTGANNSLAKAFDLGAIDPTGQRVIGLTMDAGPTNSNRQKWYRVEYPISLLPAAAMINLALAPGSPQNIHLALYDSAGNLIQNGTANADGESLTQTGLTGTYYLAVSGADSSTTNPGFGLQFAPSAAPEIVANPGTLEFSTTAYSEPESGGVATITVNRVSGSDGTVQVGFAAIGGTAQPGVNYQTNSGTLTFGPGVTSQSFTVQVLDDGQVNGPTTVNLHLTYIAGSAPLGDPSTATLTIGEADTAPPPGAGSVQFAAPTFGVAENAASATVTITRSGGSAGGVTVAYTTTDGSAHSGSNYASTSGIVSFGPGETSKSFTVPILDDGRVNGDTSLTLTLTAPGGGATLGSQSTATLVIRETDTAQPPPAQPLVTVAGVQIVAGKRGTSQIVVSFTGALSQASAQNLADYALACLRQVRRRGHNTTVQKPIRLRSAAYNAAALSVTLTPATHLAPGGIESLTITGLIDALGRAFDARHDGQPGGTYTATLARQGTVAARSSTPAGPLQALRLRVRPEREPVSVRRRV